MDADAVSPGGTSPGSVDMVAVALLVVMVQLPTSLMSSRTVAVLPTATLAVALWPSTVAVTPVSPSPLLAAVNRPAWETVPSEGLATAQAAAAGGICTWAPAAVTPDRVSCWVAPLPRSGSAGETARDASLLTTSTGSLVVTGPSRATSRPVPARAAWNWPPDQVPSEAGWTVTRTVPLAGLPARSRA